MITEQHIEVKRTARYYTFGQLSSATRYIWFCLHGYGQLAGSFIKRFESLNPTKHFVVAPEALSRFYWDGTTNFTNKPAATWMTSEDRLNEIKDYVNYLDSLYLHIMQAIDSELVTVNALGFSQGTATLSRWITNGRSPVHNLIFWAGQIAHDIDWQKAQESWKNTRIFTLYGNEDRFVIPHHIEQQKATLTQNGFDTTIIAFKGKHKVKKEALLELVNRIGD